MNANVLVCAPAAHYTLLMFLILFAFIRVHLRTTMLLKKVIKK